MNKLTTKTIINVASSLAIAFFAMAAAILIISPLSRNYYNVNLIELGELKFLLPGFLAGSVAMFFIQRKAKLTDVTLTISLAWLVLIFVFVIQAPVVSLAIGGFLVAVPAAFAILGVTKASMNAEGPLFRKILRWTLLGASLVLFLLIFAWIFIKSAEEYVPYIGLNLAKISAAEIFGEDMLKVWKVGLYIFAGAILIYAVFSFFRKLDLRGRKLAKISATVFPAVFLVAQVVVFSLFMVYRVKSMIASTYDFGIFTQMFYNMKNMQGMVTTLERSVAMSHLSVHFSPIYYLMLPAFAVFPYPETLQVLQVLVAASGVIPLFLIMKELKTGTLMRMLFLIMYIASPAIISSSMYDIHENCFLAPLLLFVIYFGIKRETIPFFLFGALTLLVKEDSGLYLVFIGLYFASANLFGDIDKKAKLKNAIHGIVLVVASLVYFIVVTNHLEASGDGAMFWRYNNINGYPDLGLTGIILSVFQNPSYFFATFFSPSKIATMLIMLGAVGFLPLFIRNRAAYLLVAPVVIMNFASNYVYQHQLGFQYFYGSGALLMFMAVLAEAEYREQPLFAKLFAKIKPTHILGLFGAAIAIAFGTKYIVGSGFGLELYQENPAKFISMKETLSSIPKDKKVVATGFLTPHLADRYYLYDYDYYNILYEEYPLDYIIIDMRINETNMDRIRNRCEMAGYVESSLSTDHILIYVPNLGD